MAIYLIIMKTPIIRLLDRENGKSVFWVNGVYVHDLFRYKLYGLLYKVRNGSFSHIDAFFIVQLFFCDLFISYYPKSSKR